MRIQQPGRRAARAFRDEPRTDGGAVGLSDEAPHCSHRELPARRTQLRDGRPHAHGDASRRMVPQRRFADVAAIGHPAALHVRGQDLLRHSRAEFHADEPLARYVVHHQAPRRGEVFDVPRAAARRAPGWVEEDRVAVGNGELLGQSQARRPSPHEGEAPRRDVYGGRVSVDGDDVDPGLGEGHGVGSDAATDVPHPPHTGLDEPLRPPPRHRRAGGLFEPCRSEQHLVGTLQLCFGAASQRNLRERPRGVFRSVLAAEALRGGKRIGIYLPRRRLERG